MGGDWVGVRDVARDDGLRKSDPAVRDIARRWDQLLRYAALRLEADIGEHVTQQLSGSQKDPSKRLQHLVDELASDGQLDGTLRIPNTVGDLELCVDLRARRISASVTAGAPEDRGGKARCTWLVNQLSPEVDRRTMTEAYAKNARTPTTATIEEVREDKDCLLGEDKRDPYRFRIVLTREMGIARKTGRKSEGFIDSVLALITDFYGTIVQNLTPWTPKAPRMSRSEPAPEPDTAPGRTEMQRTPRQLEDPDEDNAGPELPAAAEGDSRVDTDSAENSEPPAVRDPWLRVHRFHRH